MFAAGVFLLVFVFFGIFPYVPTEWTVSLATCKHRSMYRTAVPSVVAKVQLLAMGTGGKDNSDVFALVAGLRFPCMTDTFIAHSLSSRFEKEL